MRICIMRRTRTIVFIVVTCILSLARTTNCDVDADSSKHTELEASKTRNNEPPSPEINVKTKNKTTTRESQPKAGVEDITSKTKKLDDDNGAARQDKISTTSEQPRAGHQPTLNTGALRRGFYVFLGLSTLALAYIVFRSFRVNKSRVQMVRKYGVLAHKQDMEMRPLPLDEDDEDDTTVFDATGLARQHS